MEIVSIERGQKKKKKKKKKKQILTKRQSKSCCHQLQMKCDNDFQRLIMQTIRVGGGGGGGEVV